MDTLIIGVGTGRCGTKSLVRLLGQQPATSATHERYGPRVRWNCPATLWPLRLWRETAQEEGLSVCAEVSLQWTPHVETFLRWADRDDRALRVVGLKRGREETIGSYMRWNADADHWSYHGDRQEPPHEWNHCFPPQMEAASKREAIGMYWDQVYSILEEIEDERVSVFSTEALNTEEGVSAILSHCGYEDPLVDVGIQVQASSMEDYRNSSQPNS